MLSLKAAIGGVLIAASFQFAFAKKAALPGTDLRSVDRAVVFAILQANEGLRIHDTKDICIGFGHGLDIHKKAAITELKDKGLKVHPSDWCSHRPHGRGMNIAIVAPIKKISPATYEFVLEVGDLSIAEGEHFATLLRRGTYVIRCESNSEPGLVSYRQTRCP
jgi:hypothetical protein